VAKDCAGNKKQQKNYIEICKELQ